MSENRFKFERSFTVKQGCELEEQRNVRCKKNSIPFRSFSKKSCVSFVAYSPVFIRCGRHYCIVGPSKSRNVGKEDDSCY